jgi:hypothetical protein
MAFMGTVGDTDTLQKLNKIAKRRKRPTIVLGTVPPKRGLNSDVRPREYLTPKEIDRLIEGARKRGRYAHGAELISVALTLEPGLNLIEIEREGERHMADVGRIALLVDNHVATVTRRGRIAAAMLLERVAALAHFSA